MSVAIAIIILALYGVLIKVYAFSFIFCYHDYAYKLHWSINYDKK